MMPLLQNSRGAILLTALLFVLAMGLSLFFWDQVPDPMPIHWDAAGQPNGFGPRWLGLTLSPALTLLMPLLTLALTAIDPRRKNTERSPHVIELIVSAQAIFFFALHAMILRAAMSPTLTLDAHMLFIAVGALLIVIGNVLPKLGANFFVGVRTPWALTDDKNWIKTQRLGARLLVLDGVFAIVMALMGWSHLPWVVALFVGVTLLSALVPVVYSWLLWRADHAR